MTGSPSRDQLEAERLDPDQCLAERRKIRDEEDYFVWCESSYGMVEIGQEQFHPAHVLERMAPPLPGAVVTTGQRWFARI